MSTTGNFYEDKAEEYFSLTFDADTSAPRERFLAKLPRRARILDAGCGSGRDLRAFKRAGHVALGIDSSVAMASLAYAYSGAECMVLRLEDIAFERSFDGIWACASLLHLPRAQLVPVLIRLHQALVFGGTLFLALQEGQGERCIEDGRHYVYYRLSEVMNALGQAGFEASESWLTTSSPLLYGTPHWINVLAIAS